MKNKLDYSVAQKIIHWIMALLIMMDLFVAQKLGNVMEEWDRLESRVDHGSLGTIIGVLFVARIFLRLRTGAPPLPQGMPDWQGRVAKAAHNTLYFLIGFLVLSGLATAINATPPIALFGVLDITLGQSTNSTFKFVRQFHEFATNAVIILIAGHIVAALHHHFVARDNATIRMLKFWRSETEA